MNYVCGFLFSWKMDRVALIKKNRGPHGMEGKWNGIGGKIKYKLVECPFMAPDFSVELQKYREPELPHVAITREFKEETGVEIASKRWHCFHINNWAHNGNKCYFFAAFGDDVGKVRTVTDEEVKIFDPIDYWDLNVFYNIPYLLRIVEVHTKAGDLQCLDPEGINSEYKKASRKPV